VFGGGFLLYYHIVKLSILKNGVDSG